MNSTSHPGTVKFALNAVSLQTLKCGSDWDDLDRPVTDAPASLIPPAVPLLNVCFGSKADLTEPTGADREGITQKIRGGLLWGHRPVWKDGDRNQRSVPYFAWKIHGPVAPE